MSIFHGDRVTLAQLDNELKTPLLYWKNTQGTHTVYLREQRCFMDFDIADGELYGWMIPKSGIAFTDNGIRRYLAESRAPKSKMHHYFFLYQYCMRSCPYCAAKLGVTMTGNHKREGFTVPDAVDKTIPIGVTVSGGEIFMSEPYQHVVIDWLERHNVRAIVALTSATYKTLKDKPLYKYFLERGRAVGERHIDISIYVTVNGHAGVPLAHPAWGTAGYKSALHCLEEMYEDRDAFNHVLVQIIANENAQKAAADLAKFEKTIYTLNAGRVYGADGREEEYSVKSVEGHKIFHGWYQQNYFGFNDPLMTTAGKPDSILQLYTGPKVVEARSFHIEWPRETKWKEVSNFNCKSCGHKTDEASCFRDGIAKNDCANVPKTECITCPVFDTCVFSNGRTHVLDYDAMECGQQRSDMVATLSMRYKMRSAEELNQRLHTGIA